MAVFAGLVMLCGLVAAAVGFILGERDMGLVVAGIIIVVGLALWLALFSGRRTS